MLESEHVSWSVSLHCSFRGNPFSVTSSTILLLSYGYSSHSGDPLQLVKIAEDAMAGFAKASEPGTWWVDSFPARKSLSFVMALS